MVDILIKHIIGHTHAHTQLVNWSDFNVFKCKRGRRVMGEQL